MIPDRDYYADKNGKLTEEPSEYASQVAVKGVFLDERIAKRFGIADTLVSTDEPGAVRSVKGNASVKIVKAEDKEEEQIEPQEPAEADESKASVKVKKAPAKKEKK